MVEDTRMTREERAESAAWAAVFAVGVIGSACTGSWFIGAGCIGGFVYHVALLW